VDTALRQNLEDDVSETIAEIIQDALDTVIKPALPSF
jgi:hypothetical protein